MRLHFILTVLSLCLAASLAASIPAAIRHGNHAEEEACLSQPRLICSVRGTEGNDVEGVVRYKPVWMKYDTTYECNVRIRAQIKGLTPGKHGFHIHTYGDVSVSDGSSTGGHFSSPGNPELPHALPSTGGRRHWGDFGNILSDAAMMGRYSRINRVITIPGIIGRGMTIHASKDKGYGFQPSGDAGARVANCVIGIANPEA